ncbi:hypothetical protein SETIT_2G033600v2 [Setaria italica]|uniref:Glutathione S-transferase n=1 Tax=Setaria italica TaxID=4555 RepID=K4A2M6_SETIT|nr:hypothetical protein SETIT_2G033600v2 [Setaria italica]
MAVEPEVVLLDFWVSPFGQRCRIALEEKDVPYEYREQDVLNCKGELLSSAPTRAQDDPRPAPRRQGHLTYVDEAWPDAAPLLPRDDPYARAEARFWADYIDKKIYGCQTRLWKLKGEAQEQAKKDLTEVLKTLESELGDKPYFAGDTFGFVDIALVPFTSWFLAYEKLGGFSIEEHCPKIVAWAKLCREGESVAKALTDPDKVEFVQFLQTKFGPM